ncbi:MAG: (2Fe-2S) ferredoxin domain-containing protein [Peptoniphilus sp.]|nr:(2Fe-2S) ferredoxin domain-containing protein [Peptoniphilus sp.]MDD7362692.1 (2Fe-2S) ferredoxin domain-containing protein [Bacillota bacterium]MDY6044909.1 (2Fe-2S) ferredoxin domain-containing protein [Peptoniphilus sp.]
MEVKVCVGARCTMMGSSNMLDELERLQNRYFKDGGLDIVHKNCLGVCKEQGIEHTPVVSIDGELITSAKPQEVCEEIMRRTGKMD